MCAHAGIIAANVTEGNNMENANAARVVRTAMRGPSRV